MSADKRKRLLRAYKLLRSINRSRSMQGSTDITGPVNKVMQYCLDRGLAKLVRRPMHEGDVRNKRNVFIADDI